MSLVQFISQKADDPNNIDEPYLRNLVNMEPSTLEQERSRLQHSLNQQMALQRTLAASHKSDFFGLKISMNDLSDMLADLRQCSINSVELELASPKVPIRAYQLLQSVLANEFVVVENIDSIQELLSLPGLVRDNVQSGNYGLALDLANMTDRLGKRFPQSTLVQKLRSDVSSSIDGMEEMLIKTLRQASRLPQLMRAVTFLRRLETSNLEQLFLESRWQFLQSQWQKIPQQLRQTQHLAFLKRVVDIFREHVFATINGYQTIFKDENLLSQTAVVATADNNNEKTSSAVTNLSLTTTDSDANDINDQFRKQQNFQLCKFARNSLKSLLGFLREHAPLITDQGDRTSLWLQLAFCAQSLGRVDCDFWPFLDSQILSKEEWLEATQHQQEMATRALKVMK